MNITRKLAAALTVGVLGFGLVGLSAPAAQADTSWGCPGCSKGSR